MTQENSDSITKMLEESKLVEPYSDEEMRVFGDDFDTLRLVATMEAYAKKARTRRAYTLTMHKNKHKYKTASLKHKLSEASDAIADFKAMDVDSIKKAADDWKFKSEQAEKDAAAKIADMQFSNLFNGAIGTAKGKNAKVIMALLDVDALKESKNQAGDIKSAIDNIAKENEGALWISATAAFWWRISNTA